MDSVVRNLGGLHSESAILKNDYDKAASVGGLFNFKLMSLPGT
jgi:hypothetical protein